MHAPLADGSLSAFLKSLGLEIDAFFEISALRYVGERIIQQWLWIRKGFVSGTVSSAILCVRAVRFFSDPLWCFSLIRLYHDSPSLSPQICHQLLLCSIKISVMSTNKTHFGCTAIKHFLMFLFKSFGIRWFMQFRNRGNTVCHWRFWITEPKKPKNMDSFQKFCSTVSIWIAIPKKQECDLNKTS